MAQRKRVMVFGSYASSLIRFRGSLIAEAVARGHQVVAVAPYIEPGIAAKIRQLGAQPRELNVTNQSLNPIGFMRSLGALKSLLRDVRPDVVIAYTIKPVVLAAIAGSACGVPSIVSMITGLGYAFGTGREPRRVVSRAVAKLLYRFALPRSTIIVVQNGEDEQLLRSFGAVRNQQRVYRTHGSGVEIDQFMPAPLPNAPAFLLIARLLKEKGVREFAAAATRLKIDHPLVRAELVGYRDGSANSISESELDDISRSGIFVWGKLDDVRPVLARCSVYVLPSYYREGIPRSILEAMAMGRPIITTDSPGCRDAVEEGVNGFVVPPRNVDALRDAMARFVDDPALAVRMGRESRRIAEEKYDVRLVNAQLLEIAEL